MRFKVETVRGHVHSSKGMLEQMLNQYDGMGYELREMYSIAASTPEYFNVLMVFEKNRPEPPNFYHEPKFDSNGKLIKEAP